MNTSECVNVEQNECVASTSSVDVDSVVQVVVDSVSDCADINVASDSVTVIVAATTCNTPSKGTGRGFHTSWQFDRPWLTYNPRLKTMFCSFCQEAGLDNAFTRGCSELKVDNV